MDIREIKNYGLEEITQSIEDYILGTSQVPYIYYNDIVTGKQIGRAHV